MTSDLLRPVLEWPRPAKRLVVVALDVAMGLAAMWLAFTLRLDTLHRPEGAQWLVYALGPVLAVPIFVKFGLYRAIFRYTGLSALAATAAAVGVYGLLLIAALVGLQSLGFPVIPRSIGVLQPLVFLLLVGTSRALARFWLAGLSHRGPRGRLLIYGAGSAGVQTAAALGSSRQFTLLGFVDDDPGKTGRSINGLTVHAPSAIEKVVDRQGITDILLALPSVPRHRRNQILQTLAPLPVHVRTLPGLADLASGRVSVQDLRELDVEDLLGRDPVPPDPSLLARDLQGQVVLVTGAGGSIGSELCRQIVQQRPACLVLLEHHEFSLYQIHQELEALAQHLATGVRLVPLLGSVTNEAVLDNLFARHRPATVYHAAAYKHVPMVEHNVAQGVINNVMGTLATARCAARHGCARFVLISTDKAVRPTNVMGGTKRVAELVLQALASEPTEGGHTCFAMVRFGNVLGSSGSVVPLFRRQIAQGGPVTVTHPEVTRYFMTISEAVQLVLQAGAMAQGGEVFVLDMGQPVKIAEMARRMIELSGLNVRHADRPYGDIEITFTGLRPGEKLYEELLIGNNPLPTAHPRIMHAHEDFLTWPVLVDSLAGLRAAVERNDLNGARQLLAQLVPGCRLDPLPSPGNPP